MAVNVEAKSALMETSPQEVLGLLREQASLFAQLERFAGRQRALVASDEVGLLLSILADRQKLSARLTQVARSLDPVRRAWDGFRSRLNPAEREEAERLLRDAGHSLRRVIVGDERDAHLLSVRKQSIAESMKATDSAGRAIRAYRPAMVPSGRFDCTSEGA